jgi:hypothetical protein
MQAWELFGTFASPLDQNRGGTAGSSTVPLPPFTQPAPELRIQGASYNIEKKEY